MGSVAEGSGFAAFLRGIFSGLLRGFLGGVGYIGHHHRSIPHPKPYGHMTSGALPSPSAGQSASFCIKAFRFDTLKRPDRVYSLVCKKTSTGTQSRVNLAQGFVLGGEGGWGGGGGGGWGVACVWGGGGGFGLSMVVAAWSV